MPSDIKLNYSFSAPLPSTSGPILPFSSLPTNVYVQNDALVEGGWQNGLKRCFVPFAASGQDRKVTEYFIRYFSDFLAQQDAPDALEKAKGMLALAEQHISRAQGWFSKKSKEIFRLEHYALATRQILGLGSEEKWRADNTALLKKWTKLGFGEETFWGCPDLVDFVFNSFLHRHIKYPHYNHTIETIGNQPHLLVNGIKTAWAQIRKTIKLDEDHRLYSMENGRKQYWLYLDQGLTQCDKEQLEPLHRERRLDTPPLSSRVELVTTHAHKEDWNLLDSRLLKGSRHTMLRFIPGAGFAEKHPEAGLENGSVYTLGWGMDWDHFSFLRPLTTAEGKWTCPDHFQFLKQDQWVTPFEVADEQLANLYEIIKRKSKEGGPFNFITSNCCGVTIDALREAKIASFCTKEHLASLSYRFIVPKCIRKPLDQVGSFIGRITPAVVTDAVTRVSAFVYSTFMLPIFSLLGAWRSSSENVDALFSNFFDIFSSDKMVFDLTRKVFKQQKDMPQTYFEKYN